MYKKKQDTWIIKLPIDNWNLLLEEEMRKDQPDKQNNLQRNNENYSKKDWELTDDIANNIYWHPKAWKIKNQRFSQNAK